LKKFFTLKRENPNESILYNIYNIWFWCDGLREFLRQSYYQSFIEIFGFDRLIINRELRDFVYIYIYIYIYDVSNFNYVIILFMWFCFSLFVSGKMCFFSL
jgi:hypothetical protein